MPESDSERGLIDALADEFLSRLRQGEQLSLEDYVERFPHLADEIRSCFPLRMQAERERLSALAAAGDPAERPPHPEAPKTRSIGDYRIIREAGRGGMGIVYEAEQISLGRKVALKTLPQHMMSDERHLRRFERKARAAARLHHTNIVPVFGIGQVENIRFYVMQFISGPGLDQVIRELRDLNQETDCNTAPTVSINVPRAESISITDFAQSIIAQSPLGKPASPDSSAPTNSGFTSADSPQEQTGEQKPGDSGSGTGTSIVTARTTLTTQTGRTALSPPGRHSSNQDYWSSVADIGRQVANALEYAHGQNVLHRDIKPSNLLLDARGTVWITDFGLAKGSEQLDLTGTGDMLGTLRYMPPEAFDGKAAASGDIYALGLTLYELLALQPAFDARDRQVLIKQVTANKPIRLDKLNPGIPRDLVTIVHKAIEREPGDRYRSAGELAEDLDRFLHDESIRARPLPVWERLLRWSRRNTSLAMAIAAVVLLLLFQAITSTIAANYFYELSEQLELTAERLQGEQEKSLGALAEAERQRSLAAERSEDLAYQLAMGHFQRGLLLCDQGEATAGILWLTLSLTELPDGHPETEAAIRRNLGAWNRQLSRLEMLVEHSQRINMASLSPDGSAILTASEDGIAQLWDIETGEKLGAPMRHAESVRVARFSSDGRLLVTASADGEVCIWSVSPLRPLHSSKRHRGAVRNARFNTDGSVLVTCGNDRTARLCDVATGEPIGDPMAHEQPIEGVDFSPDGNLLVTGSWDGTARLWDARTSEPVGKPIRHENAVLSASFSPDGLSVLISSRDGVARLWNVSTQEPASEPLRHADAIEVAEFSPDGTRILTASDDRTARIWDASTGLPIGSPAVHSILIRAAAFRQDGKRFVTGSDDHTARVWDTETGQPQATLLTHQGVVRSVSFHPDGTRILTGSYDRTARIWNVPERILSSLTIPLSGRLRRIAFSPDGSQLICVSQEDLMGVHLWDARTGQRRGASLQHPQEAWAIAFDEDCSRIAIGGYDKLVQILDPQTGQALQAPLQHDSQVHTAAFSRDGQFLVTGCRGQTAYLWNLKSGKIQLGPLEHTGRIYAVAISPDNSRMITGTDNNGGQLWDARTGKPIGKPLPHQGMIQSLAFSPDGKMILTGSFDRTARLWDAVTGDPIGEPLVHPGPVWSVDFGPDSRTVITGCSANTARLWDVKTSLPIGPPIRHTAPVRGVKFCRDGKAVMSLDENGQLQTTPVPESLTRDAHELQIWSQVITGMKLTPRGTLTALELLEWNRLRQQLSQIKTPPAP